MRAGIQEISQRWQGPREAMAAAHIILPLGNQTSTIEVIRNHYGLTQRKSIPTPNILMILPTALNPSNPTDPDELPAYTLYPGDEVHNLITIWFTPDQSAQATWGRHPSPTWPPLGIRDIVQQKNKKQKPRKETNPLHQPTALKKATPKTGCTQNTTAETSPIQQIYKKIKPIPAKQI